MIPMVQEMDINEKVRHMFDWNMDGPLYTSLIVMLALLIVGIIVGVQARVSLKKKKYLNRPKGLLMLAEWGVEKVDGWTKDTMDHAYTPVWPGYFMVLFTYLFFAFNAGLLGLPSVIDWLAGPLSLAIIMLVLIHVQAIRFQRWSYFKRYVEPFAVFLPVNLVTMWSPLLSTTMRMFGNALAGGVVIGLVQWSLSGVSETIIQSITGVAEGTEWAGVLLAPIPMGILNLYFSLFSGAIQTLVFCTLNGLWIAAERPNVDASPALNDRERIPANK